MPTCSPTYSPTYSPTCLPTYSPTEPTRSPTLNPTESPLISLFPTRPSVAPTSTPSINPTLTPSQSPSNNPSITPSRFPTKLPTLIPTRIPSNSPSKQPSQTPSNLPSCSPSSNPTQSTIQPSTNKPTIAPSTSNPTTLNPTTVSPTISSSRPTTYPTTLSPTTGTPTYTSVTNLPTTTPTVVPSAPTLLPTFGGPLSLTQFQALQTVLGVNASKWNSGADYDTVFSTSVAIALGVVSISSRNVSIISVVNSNTFSSRRMLQEASSSTAGSVNVTYRVGVYAQLVGFDNSYDAYSALSATLEESIKNGDFTDILQATASANSLTSVLVAPISDNIVLLPENPSAVPTMAPSSAAAITNGIDSGVQSDLSAGAIGGIAIAVLALLAIVGAAYFFLHKRLKFHQQWRAESETTASRSKISPALGLVSAPAAEVGVTHIQFLVTDPDLTLPVQNPLQQKANFSVKKHFHDEDL